MSRALFVLGASALALAGCGGSDSEVNVPSAAPTVAQVTTAPAAQGGAEGETTPAAVAANTVPRPAIVQRRIPFPAKRRA